MAASRKPAASLASSDSSRKLAIRRAIRPSRVGLSVAVIGSTQPGELVTYSSNIDANVSIGTIFSIHRKISSAPRGTLEDCLQVGRKQVAAGYVVYGSSTMLVYTTGTGVHGFTLDPFLPKGWRSYGFRFRVPYGTLLCVSDKPLHGELKLPGMASDFYHTQVTRHLRIGIRALEKLRDMPPERLHSRKLRSFAEVAFQ